MQTHRKLIWCSAETMLRCSRVKFYQLMHCSGLCFREYRCRFTNTDTMLFCMRVMVGVIILYDHVHPVGAFAKTSKIDVRAPVSLPIILG